MSDEDQWAFAFNQEYQTTLARITDEKILEVSWSVPQALALAVHFAHAQEYDAFETLTRLARDFKSAALQYGKVIISERFLPLTRKTIKPSDVGGLVGGDKVSILRACGAFFALATSCHIYTSNHAHLYFCSILLLVSCSSSFLTAEGKNSAYGLNFD